MGGVYALMSLGLALSFGIMKVVNVAQGDFMMLGMYCTYFLYTAYGVHPVYGAVLIIPPFYWLGTMVQRVFLGHVSGRGTLQDMPAQLMLTLGLSLILSHSVAMRLGSSPRGLVTPLATEAFQWHGLMFNQARTYALAVALFMACTAYVFLHYTDLGKALRAAADEPEAAMYMGIDVRRMHTIACGVGIALAAVAGGLLAMIWPITPGVTAHFLMLMFITVVLGGLGSIPGSFVGGLVIGVVQSLSLLVLPMQLQNVSVLVVFLVLLYLRPHGLFGHPGRVV